MKRPFSRKLLCILTVLALLVSLFPAVSAEEISEEESAASVVEAEPFADADAAAVLPDPEELPSSEDASPAGDNTDDTMEAVPGSEGEASEEQASAPEDTSAVGEDILDSVLEEEDLTEVELPSEETPASESSDQPEEGPTPSDEAEAEAKTDQTCSFPGMPEGYLFSEEELRLKAELTEHGILDALETCPYEEGIVLLLTDSLSYAEAAAAAYGAVLLSFDGCFACLELHGATVEEAVRAAADPALPLPAVEPDWAVSLEPEIDGDASGFTLRSAAADAPLEWYDWVKSLGLDDTFLQDPDGRYQWMHDAVDSFAAWGITMGSSSITVAVIDTGVDSSHPDLGNLIPGRNTLTAAGTENTEDDSGHGTHVAGIIAAQGFNGRGGVGIAPGVRIMPIRALSASGGSNGSLARGINWAVANGADIINISAGGSVYSSVLEAAISNAWASGVTVIVSMCNGTYGGSNICHYPAAYDHVVAVAATDRTGTLAEYSHYGSWCDLSAPGSGIWSTYRSRSYRELSGTSMATPVVAGAAALYMSAYGKQSPDTMASLLRAATNPGTGSGMGSGIIDIGKLLGKPKSAPVFRVGTDRRDPGGSTVKLTSADPVWVESGVEDSRERILYTTDNTKPAMLNGEIQNGTELPAGEAISLDGIAVGKTLTVRAVRVNGMGAASNEAKLKVTVVTPTSEAEREEVRISFTAQPKKYLVAGKSFRFQAEVVSNLGTSLKQDISWKLDGQDAGLGAKINSSTGVLTTKSGKSGFVRVVAVSKAYPEASASLIVEVVVVPPVAKMKLNASSLTLYLPSAVKGSLSVTCKDSKGNLLENSDVGIRWSSSNKKVVTVDETGTLTALKKGTATVTAKAADGSGKSVTCTVKVRQYVTEITVSGRPYMSPGDSQTLKTAVLPDSANSKGLVWSVTACSDEALRSKISISKKSVLKVGKSVPSGAWFEVTAAAADGSGICSKPVRVTVSAKTARITVAPSAAPTVPVTDSTGSVTGAILWRRSGENSTLSLVAVREVPSADGTTGHFSDAVLWKSSNKKAATVDEDGTVTAVGVGTAVITASANDGSGKKTTFKIRVINPASSLTLLSGAPGASTYVSFGKSLRVRAALGDTYGKPTVTALNWSFRVFGAGGAYDEALTETLRTGKLITLSSDGVLKIKTGARAYGISKVQVQAEATDGTDLWDSLDLQVVEPTSSLSLREYDLSSGRLELLALKKSVRLTVNDGEGSTVKLCIVSDGVCPDFTVSSENAKIAGAYVTQQVVTAADGSAAQSFLNIVGGMKPGSTKVTVRTCDGSGCSVAITVKVVKN